jgi:phage shock protein PspC (stress-responsive transcriptional regulator)
MEQATLNPTPTPTPARRLERGDGPLGGVAAGLATYFEVDPTLVRLGLVATTLIGGPTIPIAYLAAWVIIPRPESATVTAEPVASPPPAPPAPVPPAPAPPAPAPPAPWAADTDTDAPADGPDNPAADAGAIDTDATDASATEAEDADPAADAGRDEDGER